MEPASTSHAHIGPAAHYEALRGRRHPYAILPDDVPAVQAMIREACSQALSDVDRMLHQAVRRRMSHLQHEDHEDAVQQVRVKLWAGLANYDASRRGVKWSTFAHAVIQRSVSHVARSIARAANKTPRKGRPLTTVSLDSPAARGLAGADQSTDRRIEAIAKDVLANPEKYLKPAWVVAAVQIATAAPHGELATYAAAAGRPLYSVNGGVSQARKVIARIDVEGWQPNIGGMV